MNFIQSCIISRFVVVVIILFVAVVVGRPSPTQEIRHVGSKWLKCPSVVLLLGLVDSIFHYKLVKALEVENPFGPECWFFNGKNLKRFKMPGN